jgi:DMSO/TMAO reductase YedYZ heme-binding membrane subunit
MRRLRPIFPGIMKFHRYQGLFAFLLACLHPLFITLTFGLYDTYVTHNITSPALQNYVWFGIIALTLMTITVLTAVGAWLFNRFKTVWRTIHVLNYIVFAAAWIHSWFIGSDVQTTVLKWFWLAYLAAWLVSVVMRIQRDRQIRVANAGQSIISESGGTNETN